VQSQVLQHVAVRSARAFPACFRRVRHGEAPLGSPHLRGQGRYESITFPQVPSGCKLETETKRLRIMNGGAGKVVLHRPREGTPKIATIQRSSTGTGSGCFSCACACAAPPPLPKAGQQAGIDVGRKTFATRSTGQESANPRFFRHEEHSLAHAQRRLAPAEAEAEAPERAARRRGVARVQERIAWRRSEFTQQHRRRLVNAVALSATEDVSVTRLVPNPGLAKSRPAAAWSQFADLLSHQPAWAGRRDGAVKPA
jgi:putative transposase